MMKLYRSYLFIEKDPVIDTMRTLVHESRMSYAEVSRHSGVSPATLGNWFHGDTRRPQFATVAAVAKGLGMSIRFGGEEIVAKSSRAALEALRKQTEKDAQRLLRLQRKRNGK